jgi:hypothetical protein
LTSPAIGAPPTMALGLHGGALRAWRAGDAASLATHADNINDVWRCSRKAQSRDGAVIDRCVWARYRI